MTDEFAIELDCSGIVHGLPSDSRVGRYLLRPRGDGYELALQACYGVEQKVQTYPREIDPERIIEDARRDLQDRLGIAGQTEELFRRDF